MSKSRLLSLIVTCFYLAAMVYFRGKLDFYSSGVLLIAILLPLACIWFGDSIAIVFDRGRWPELNPNWGFFVRFIGWFLLFLPAIVFIYNKIKTR